MKTLGELTLGRRPEGTTALRAKWVIGFSEGEHRLIENGEVVMKGDRIIHVGSRYRGAVSHHIDLGESLVSPGFVDLDALSDLDTTILGNDNHPAWAKGRVWPRSYIERGPYEMYSPEELAFQKRFAFAQLLMNGITTALPIASLFYREWGETREEFEAAAQAAGELGLRTYLGPSYRSGGMVVEGPGKLKPVFDEQRGLQGLQESVEFIQEFDGSCNGLIKGLLAPDRVETCTEQLLSLTGKYAEQLDCPIRLHCAQGEMEVNTIRKLHGMTSPEWLSRIGILDHRLIAPHATFATEKDLELFQKHKVTIAHCPLVFMRSGIALRSFRRCLDMGINIGMGTDTAPPDMVLNMSVGLMACRLIEKDPLAVTSGEMFNAATLGGATALGRTDIGRLAVGAKADISIFDMQDSWMAPRIDPVQTLIAGSSGRVTKAVFVDGRLSMRFGEVAGMDIKSARKRAQEQFDGLVRKYPERTYGHPEVESIFPPTYRRLDGS